MNADALIQNRDALKDAKALTGVSADAVLAAAGAAGKRIPPLWPLKNFVAVNPMLGLTGLPFAKAAEALGEAAGARMIMPRRFFDAAIRDGRITDADIETAIAELSADVTVADVKEAAGETDAATTRTISTFADVAGDVIGTDWSSFIRERISAWAGAYYDDGQALWRSPWRSLPPYAAWRAEAQLDRTPEIMGLKGFRAAIAALPETPEAVLVAAVARLRIPASRMTAYFHRLLADIAGWAGHARYRGWLKELRGERATEIVEVLAARAGFEAALHDCLIGDERIAAAWADAHNALEAAAVKEETAAGRSIDEVLQAAYEIAFRAQVLAPLKTHAQDGAAAEKIRPAAQAVFCIDVRSERYRRALEGVNPEIETFGFAGFFGFPIEVARLEETGGAAQCPVLLEPAFLIAEDVKDDTPGAEARTITARTIANGVAGAWKSFKTAAVSSFAFVEALGVTGGGAMAKETLGRGKAWARKRPEALSLKSEERHGRKAGISPAERLATAENALAGMSISGETARVVVLAGHGSTTNNNPYASGLDCGACGGHTGEASARVAVAALNDPVVREGLKARGKGLPDDTIFVAALHDTTTDEISLFDPDDIPASHADDIRQLKKDLAEASARVRRERAASLGLQPAENLDREIDARSRDWSEVRPEWGLAGCAAFIVAPRERTKALNLEGRAFLHSYDWRQDTEKAVLELIMTAPLVVASWISLQYYGSTVDNVAFGSGDKTLHNVVGGLGVLEGNSGDLRSGLPMQSIHDGRKFVHEPMRLTAVIEAPIAYINEILEKHAHVRELFDNEWLRLVAVLDEGRTLKRYAGDLEWSDLDFDAEAETKAAV